MGAALVGLCAAFRLASSAWAMAPSRVMSISLSVSRVSMFCSPNRLPMPNCFSFRMASGHSLLFRANREVDLVSTRSIFPFRQLERSR